jgi:hypothetical protein
MFECHITLDKEHAFAATAITDDQAPIWKTSEIARDPLLGDKNFFYLTTHHAELRTIQRRMDWMVDFLRSHGIPVLREKIEVIIHDFRY